MSCVILKPLRDRAVGENDYIDFTNRELVPLVRQMRRFLQDTLGTDWCAIPTDGAEDGDIIVYDGDDGPGWTDSSTVTGLLSPLTTKGDIWGYDTADARIPVGSDDEILIADSLNSLGVRWDTFDALLPLTTKGDLLGFDTAPARVPVGSDGQILFADSADAQGVSWQTRTVNATSPVLIDGTTSADLGADVTLSLDQSALEAALDQDLEEVLIVGDDANDQIIQGLGYLEVTKEGGAASALVDIKADTSQETRIRFYQNAVLRASVGLSTGSVTQIESYDTGGSLIDSPLSWGNASVNNFITAARDLDMDQNDIRDAGSIKVNTVGLTGVLGNAYITAQGDAGFVRGFNFNTGDFLRWRFWADQAAETGSNAGSNFRISAYTDTGSSIDTPIYIVRAAGGYIQTSRDINIQGYDIDNVGSLLMDEASAVPNSPGGGEGTWWVRNDAPNVPMFTDDGGTDHVLLYAEDVPTIEEVLIAGDDANGQILQGLAALWVEATVPVIYINETDATVDEGLWRIVADSDTLGFQVRDDANSSGANFVRVNRTGTTVDSFEHLSDVDMNANDIDMEFGSLLNAGSVEIDQVGQATDAFQYLKADSANNIYIQFQHGANRRWRDRIVASSANRLFEAFDATGVSIDVPISITNAAGGDIDLQRRLDMNVHDIVNVADNLQFDTSVDPVIWQEVAASGSGVDMYVIAQQGASGGNGGDLFLVGGDQGTGETAVGAVHTQAGLGNTTMTFFDSITRFFVDGDLNGNDFFVGGGDIDGEGIGSRVVDFEQLHTSGWSVASAPSGYNNGSFAYCTNGDAGNPCLAVYYGGSWRVAVTDLGSLTAIASS